MPRRVSAVAPVRYAAAAMQNLSRPVLLMVALVVVAGAVVLTQPFPEASGPDEPAPTASPSLSPDSTPTTPDGAASSPGATPLDGTPASPPPEEGLREVVDEGAGFTVTFPAEWQIVTTVEPTMRVSVSAGGANGFWIRAMPVRELGESLADKQALAGISVESAQDLQGLRPILDRIIQEAETTVRVLQGPQILTLGDLPTVAYVYHFRDTAQEQVGVHAHYFAFLGPRVYVLVMQALPREEFGALQTTFSRIVDSFRLVTD